MRGNDIRRDGLFSYVRPESRIPSSHPLRLIRGVADAALKALDTQLAALYAENGRPSIPPEQLLRALLVQAFYTIRSERQLMEQLNYNLLSAGSLACRLTIRSGCRRCLARTATGCWRRHRGSVYGRGAEPAAVKAVLSDEHFSVDCTLIQAWRP